MEPPTSSGNEHGFGAGAPHSTAHGPVLYVPPLRIMCPTGGPPFFPPPYSAQGPFNGFHADLFGQRMQQDGVMKSARARPVGKKESGSDVHVGKTQQGSANGKRSKGQGGVASTEKQSKPAEAAKPVDSQNEKGDPMTSSPPDATPKNRKRNRPSTTPEARKMRRSLGKAGRMGASGPGGLAPTDPKKAVIETLRLYDALRRNLLQEEEIKGKEAVKGRADLNAGSIVNAKGLSVNRMEKIVGSVPGVEVGDQFYFRTEICCIGMHGPIQAGIEYLTTKESEWNTPVAISIISSGGYDDRDDGEVLIYTGQGGKSALDNKQTEDQKLERGNLAMDESMKYQVPVRVIRGLKDGASPSGKIYTYDGLYKVVESWSEKGKAGFEEFKFRLQRLPGQPELGSAVIKLTNHLKYKPSMREGLLLDDISTGRENFPVCIVNTVDGDRSPAFFEYATKVQSPAGSSQLDGPVGCECKGVCSASIGCLCFSRNGNEFAYVNSGVLVKEKGKIYECGSNCKCSLTCRNRLTQKGVKYRFEVFKTNNRGWGLRSWDPIPAGSFVCEYSGKVVTNMDAMMGNNDFLLNLKRVPKNKTRWGDVSGILESQRFDTSYGAERPELLLDSSQIGNVARFINHSCSPNLLVQCVFHDHHDLRFPHIMLFAMDNIPPLKELTFDYGGRVSDEGGRESEVMSKDCLCGAADCRGKLFY